MAFKTADLYDDFASELSIAAPGFIHYGKKICFSGKIATVKVHEDNVLVKNRISSAGDGKVLVVDGGGSMRCALLGDILAQRGVDNRWAGIIVYGCIRDSAEIAGMPIGVMALGTSPAKSVKRGAGVEFEPVVFAGITFTPGHYVYCDHDGIVTSARDLLNLRGKPS